VESIDWEAELLCWEEFVDLMKRFVGEVVGNEDEGCYYEGIGNRVEGGDVRMICM
jgi:hypothetical protein